MYETPEQPDISEGMGIEDYSLGRPNRAQQAPVPSLYQEGWDYAAAEQARLVLNRKAGRPIRMAEPLSSLESAMLNKPRFNTELTHLPQPEQPSENWLRQARVDAEVRGDAAEADRLTELIRKAMR